MAPAPLSPVSNMSPQQPSSSSTTDLTSDGIRKRVCKACDRCRLKKSKCDGSHPCSRCKADNAICVFGERKKSHDKVYPKGYVEMLEQQQGQLVSGLQEMYKRSLAGRSWEVPALSETNGHPLTHDILAALNLLEAKQDGSGESETFEVDCQRLQSKLLEGGAGYVRHRRSSFSSDSEHSQRGGGGRPSTTTTTTTTSRKSPPSAPAPVASASQPLFRDNFSFSASPSPLPPSPIARQRQSWHNAAPPTLQQRRQQRHTHPHALMQETSPLTNDPQFYQAEWSLAHLSEPNNNLLKQSDNFALHEDNNNNNNNNNNNYNDDDDDLADADQLLSWDDDAAAAGGLFASYPPQNFLSGIAHTTTSDFGAVDPMELDFKQFIQVAT